MKEKINRFEFLICYYSHLKDTEKKIRRNLIIYYYCYGYLKLTP